MYCHRVRERTPRSGTTALAALALMSVALGPGLARHTGARAQQPATPAPLVFDGVTVIDVQQGHRLPNQRVVIVGNRIRAMGSARTVPLPAGARVVDAHGKYLIPGLWDMHTHPQHSIDVFHPLFIANGITGIRDASSIVPLDTQILWRREILAGTRVGPPRQLLSGGALDEKTPCTRVRGEGHICVADAADARHVVDSLKSAGADMLKTYEMGKEIYFTIAAEARRIGILFGGHDTETTAIEASDSGASILDHVENAGGDDDVLFLCLRLKSSSVKKCGQVAERFRRNGTWWVPTLLIYDHETHSPSGANFPAYHRNLASDTILARWHEFARTAGADSGVSLDLRRGPLSGVEKAPEDYLPSVTDTGPCGIRKGLLRIAQCVGLPILAGTDEGDILQPAGFALHTELALYVAEGLTPLEALQTATLNPATLLHGTDSLGTIAVGKLADLVLLDADPLQDITNTTRIRAVVANGRYFDRTALDRLVTEARSKAIQNKE